MARKQTLNGKVVAITGGARGIGLATAKALVAKGARVSIGDVHADLAQQEAVPLKGYGGALDVRDRASYAAFLKATADALGPMDVLINNAGIMPTGNFTDETDDISDTLIDVNLRGVILGCKLALPEMINRGQGHIVNVASMAGVLPVPGLAVYCATKFAVVGLTQTLREEYRDSGVSFSSILPAKVTTELASGTDRAGSGVPTSSPEDVAAAVIEAIENKMGEVTVPRYMSVTPALLGVLPKPLQRGLRRLLGDRRILEELDDAARADYDARIAQLADK
ncbi:MAG: NADP-dependent 3-hydroxy acid dehydrogenase YdfG [Gammaproteobacteria bacterium]|jgi:NADP-dependent 3-hydroxy acid dehydrogenase YdfG